VQEELWRIMRHCGVPEELVVLIEDIHGKSRSAVRVEEEQTDWFMIKVWNVGRSIQADA